MTGAWVPSHPHPHHTHPPHLTERRERKKGGGRWGGPYSEYPHRIPDSPLGTGVLSVYIYKESHTNRPTQKSLTPALYPKRAPDRRKWWSDFIYIGAKGRIMIYVNNEISTVREDEA